MLDRVLAVSTGIAIVFWGLAGKALEESLKAQFARALRSRAKTNAQLRN